MHVMDRRLLLLQQIDGTIQVGLQINKVSITRIRKAAVHGYKSQVTEGLVVHTEKKHAQLHTHRPPQEASRGHAAPTMGRPLDRDQ